MKRKYTPNEKNQLPEKATIANDMGLHLHSELSSGEGRKQSNGVYGNPYP
jgi:hypothetical protein